MQKIFTTTLLIISSLLGNAQWTTENLSVGRYQLAAAAAGNIAMFGGGLINSNFTLSSRSDVIDVYNASTNTWTTAQLSLARTNLFAASAGTKILFAGGDTALSPFYQTKRVEIYDVTTSTWSMAQLSLARAQMTAISAGNKCFFAGGVYSSSNLRTDTVDIYDAPTNTWSVTRMPTARAIAGGAYCNGKVYIAGGSGVGLSGVVTTVDIYDIASATWSTIPFPNPRRWLTGGSLGNLVFFAGGDVTQSNSDYIDIYNSTTGQWSLKTMAAGKQYIEIASLGNKIYFAGGSDAGYFPKNTIDIYDISTGVWSTHILSVARSRHAAVKVGHRVMFAGGSFIVQGGLPQISVDVFTDATVGIAETGSDQNDLAVYPNPASSIININMADQLLYIKIFDINGRLLYASETGAINMTIDITGFKNGVYCLQSISGSSLNARVTNTRFVVQH